MRQLRDFKEDMCYHLISRIAHRAFYLDAEERTRFVDRMWRVAGFSGVMVLAYCVMSNHFHILVHVPELVPLSDDGLLGRIRILYFGDRLAEIEAEWTRVTKDPAAKEEFRQRFLRRMGNVSEFMKTLKQNTSMSINSRNLHAGTMWEARFYARAYAPEDVALMNVAAYIDRNPVKAGIVAWPDAYPWCGYAAASRGDARCINGYAFIYSPAATPDREEILETHGQMISGALRELSEESAGAFAKTGMSVDEKKLEKVRARAFEVEAESRMERVPHLVERGSNKVAFDLLVLLRAGSRRPAELRLALDIASVSYFRSHYLTPMEASGFIEVADGCARRSPVKKFRLTEKGRAVVEAQHGHSNMVTRV